MGQLFDRTDSVPVRARGNSKLQVERVTGFEAGYRGDISRKAYVTLDLYLDILRDFVTDLLPAVNPAFPRWTAPSAVPAQFRSALQDAVRNALLANPATALAGRGLTRLENGRTAIVLSYTNAGKVTQLGAEVGAGVQLSRDFRADGSISLFDYEVNNQAQGDNLLANTPSAKGNVSLTYANRQGFDASATFRAVKGYDWAAGVFIGYIEPQTQVDASVGYNVNNNLRVFATGINVFDQQRYAIYGGSVNGRRILAGLTTRF